MPIMKKKKDFKKKELNSKDAKISVYKTICIMGYWTLSSRPMKALSKAS